MQHRRRAPVVVALGALLGMLAVLGGLGSHLDLAWLDALQRTHRPDQPARVVLVDIDERTTLAFGWPVDSGLYAAVIEALREAGARGVGFDLLLADRGLSFSADAGGASRGGASPEDLLLGTVAGGAGVVFGAQVLGRDGGSERELPATPPGVRAHCDPDPNAFVVPLRSGLSKAPVGHVQVSGGTVDGAYRAIVPCVAVHDGCVPDLGSMLIGAEPEGCEEVLVPWSRSFDDYPRLSMYDLIGMTGDAGGLAELRRAVEGRYVLIGASDPGISDLGRTPTSSREPLVTLHANRVDALLTGRSLSVRPWGLPLAVVGLLLLAALRLPARGWLGVAVATVGVGATCSWAAFHLGSAWLPPAALTLPLLGASLAAASQQGWRNLRYNQMLTQAFGSYVSPDVLDWLRSTEGAALSPRAAERREITVLFSDIAGYTALSNRLPPDRVIASLRLYLEAMVAIVQEHGGYLDKINGDGLMVIFGAPRPADDPAAAAVACARHMQAEVVRLQSSWREITGGDLAIRVGLATGSAFVGNLGGQGHVEYTAIGPVVNLAARLESQAPVGGVLLCAKTWEEVQPTAGAWVEVQLKGYAEPVRAWAMAGPQREA